ncbi:hypothetical protein Pelo_3319 [Pelomyxa schiedti]|nr:hypothetical protein Pelo_3319 [Pelomyxa schiedti]
MSATHNFRELPTLLSNKFCKECGNLVNKYDTTGMTPDRVDEMRRAKQLISVCELCNNYAHTWCVGVLSHFIACPGGASRGLGLSSDTGTSGSGARQKLSAVAHFENLAQKSAPQPQQVGRGAGAARLQKFGGSSTVQTVPTQQIPKSASATQLRGTVRVVTASIHSTAVIHSHPTSTPNTTPKKDIPTTPSQIVSISKPTSTTSQELATQPNPEALNQSTPPHTTPQQEAQNKTEVQPILEAKSNLDQPLQPQPQPQPQPQMQQPEQAPTKMEPDSHSEIKKKEVEPEPVFKQESQSKPSNEPQVEIPQKQEMETPQVTESDTPLEAPHQTVPEQPLQPTPVLETSSTVERETPSQEEREPDPKVEEIQPTLKTAPQVLPEAPVSQPSEQLSQEVHPPQVAEKEQVEQNACQEVHQEDPQNPETERLKDEVPETSQENDHLNSNDVPPKTGSSVAAPETEIASMPNADTDGDTIKRTSKHKHKSRDTAPSEPQSISPVEQPPSDQIPEEGQDIPKEPEEQLPQVSDVTPTPEKPQKHRHRHKSCSPTPVEPEPAAPIEQPVQEEHHKSRRLRHHHTTALVHSEGAMEPTSTVTTRSHAHRSRSLQVETEMDIMNAAALRIQRAYRGWRFVCYVRTAAAKVRLKRNVVHELLSTEESYKLQLIALNNDFYSPLASSKILDTETLDNLFPAIEDIYVHHLIFSQKLKAVVETWKPTSDIYPPLIFLLDKPELIECYQKFITSHQMNQKHLATLYKENKRFREFIDTRRSPNMGSGMMYLNSLLITLVQRLPRYKLMFRDLEKASCPWSEDVTQLPQIIQQMHAFTLEVNKKAGEARDHNFEKAFFKSPQWCSKCYKLLFGLGTNGLRCSSCGVVAHFKCHLSFHGDCGLTDLRGSVEINLAESCSIGGALRKKS